MALRVLLLSWNQSLFTLDVFVSESNDIKKMFTNCVLSQRKPSAKK